MDNYIISALVSAGTCHGHRPQTRTIVNSTRCQSSHHKHRRKESCRVGLHTCAKVGQQPAPLQFHATREEYNNLLDGYDNLQGDPNGPPLPTDPALLVCKSTFTQPLPELTDEGGEDEQFKASEESSLGKRHDGAVQDVIRLAKDEESSYEDIYQAYKKLPSPGVALLPKNAIRGLLNRMSVPPVKNEKVMLRYLSLVDDMKEAGRPLTENEWNSAVHLAGRCLKTVGATEVESAIRMWKSMEHEAGIRASTSTFNILFDISVKAGKFALADMVLAEMKERKLELDRFTWTGLIYSEGAKGNGDGVRAAYRSHVEAGEIVDTVVLTCVIHSLIRAGEAPAAELLFERMKRMNARFLKAANVGSPLDLPPPSPRRKKLQNLRNLRAALKDAPRLLKHSHEDHKKLQDSRSLTPGLSTFSALISHHAMSTGELDRVAGLLHEMKYYGIPLDGSIFLSLIRGFSIHGGIRYSVWTRTRLEQVWFAFWRAAHPRNPRVEEANAGRPNEAVYLGKWMIMWCLRAFCRCAGTGRMLEAWEEIKGKWEPEPGELEHVQRFIMVLIDEHHRPTWERE